MSLITAAVSGAYAGNIESVFPLQCFVNFLQEAVRALNARADIRVTELP